MDRVNQDPERVLSDSHLTKLQKNRILHDLEGNQISFLRATDEDMRKKNSNGNVRDILRRAKMAEMELMKIPDSECVYEAVAVFTNAADLQAALDELQSSGFMRQELSVLANEKAVEEKLGHRYRKIQEAEDDPDAPRTIFVANETISEAEGSAIGLPMYMAATTATGVVVASGGTMLAAILAMAAGGSIGAAIGTVLARLIAHHHAQYIQEQIDLGGILLWVHLRAPEMKDIALRVLDKHASHDVHVHEISLYGHQKGEKPMTSTNLLKSFLGDTYALMIKTHFFHWNVTGPEFPVLHTMFEKQYMDLFEAADTVAERIRALGDHPPGGTKAFAQITSVEDPKLELDANDILDVLIKDHKNLAECAKKGIKVANQANDDATADLLIGRIHEHEKQAWMMSSMRKAA